MGGPKASRAMRTISMARTTPAQNPRGFSRSKVLPSSSTAISLLSRVHVPSGVPNKLPEKCPFGQRKPQKRQGLAAAGEFCVVNGSAGCVPVQLEMEKRSPVKIMERTHEEATEALHAGRESCHPKEASAGDSNKRRTVERTTGLSSTSRTRFLGMANLTQL